ERILWDGDEKLKVLSAGLSWSPDGRLLAYAAAEKGQNGSAVYALDLNNGAASRISQRVQNRVVNVAWLSDGSGLLVNRNTSNDASDGQIWFAPYPAAEMSPVTNDLQNYSLFSLSISSGNRAVVIDARSDPEIWLAPDGHVDHAQKIFAGNRLRLEGQ